MIPYGKQELSEKDLDAVNSVLKSDYWTQGPKIEEFENKFADFCKSKYAVACSSGTAALHLSYLTQKSSRKNGNKVLTTPLSFSATSNAMLYCGLVPEFVDIDPNTLIIDFNELEVKLSNSPEEYVGISIVHFAGLYANMEALYKLATEYELWIIEDCCHAPGANFLTSSDTVSQSGSCNFSSCSTFSFHPVKHIACGEGGMITTNNKATYDKLKSLRSHGPSKIGTPETGLWLQELYELGFNYRMSDINAALGISQLERIQYSISRRNEIAKKYDLELQRLPLKLAPRGNGNHAFHLYVIQTPKRKELYDFLREREILTQVHYKPIHTTNYYIEKVLKSKISLPKVEKYYEECLSLPIFPSLTEKDLTFIINSIKEFFEN